MKRKVFDWQRPQDEDDVAPGPRAVARRMGTRTGALLVAAVLTIVGSCAPWETATGITLAGTHNLGKITFVAAAFLIILCMALVLEQCGPYLVVRYALLAGLVCFGLGIYKLIDLHRTAPGITSDFDTALGAAWGLYVTVVGGIAMLAAAAGFAQRERLTLRSLAGMPPRAPREPREPAAPADRAS
ncbi:MAG TPA: hypothetical protein VHX88_00655 [Solirubrobacteraceae bacterium]|jgi:hypothetical protein|nr:hypothetical protein [Solirubrobacteraceae bacterium]